MSQLLVNLPTGEVEYYPNDSATSRPHHKVVAVTPDIETLLGQGGPFRWQPDDLENPEGSGALIKMELEDPVPSEIEPAQLREWLIRNGKLNAVNAAISALPDPEKTIMASWFEYARQIRRSNPKVVALAQALGMTDEQVDQAFREASQF